MLLKVGSKGDDVKKLQTKLGTTSDGDFGSGVILVPVPRSWLKNGKPKMD